MLSWSSIAIRSYVVHGVLKHTHVCVHVQSSSSEPLRIRRHSGIGTPTRTCSPMSHAPSTHAEAPPDNLPAPLCLAHSLPLCLSAHPHPHGHDMDTITHLDRKHGPAGGGPEVLLQDHVRHFGGDLMMEHEFVSEMTTICT